MMNDKVKLLETKRDKNLAAFQAALREIEDPDFGKRQLAIAKYQKSRYDAFIKVGFTPEQAIQLLA